jgi:hypothetical protein
MNTTTANLTPGTYLRLTFGRGTQLFFVSRVSAKGKPFGLRCNGGTWTCSSIKVDDPRIDAVLTADEARAYCLERDYRWDPPTAEIARAEAAGELARAAEFDEEAAELEAGPAVTTHESFNQFNGKTYTYTRNHHERAAWARKRAASHRRVAVVCNARALELAALELIAEGGAR